MCINAEGKTEGAWVQTSQYEGITTLPEDKKRSLESQPQQIMTVLPGWLLLAD